MVAERLAQEVLEKKENNMTNQEWLDTSSSNVGGVDIDIIHKLIDKAYDQNDGTKTDKFYDDLNTLYVKEAMKTVDDESLAAMYQNYLDDYDKEPCELDTHDIAMKAKNDNEFLDYMLNVFHEDGVEKLELKLILDEYDEREVI